MSLYKFEKKISKHGKLTVDAEFGFGFDAAKFVGRFQAVRASIRWFCVAHNESDFIAADDDDMFRSAEDLFIVAETTNLRLRFAKIDTTFEHRLFR